MKGIYSHHWGEAPCMVGQMDPEVAESNLQMKPVAEVQ